MSLLVTGSIGIDTVKTPFGVSENCVGGSAVYFSMAASYFSQVRFKSFRIISVPGITAVVTFF